MESGSKRKPTSFKKGEGGRKKGSINKVTRDMREIHGLILEAIQKKVGIDELIEKAGEQSILTYLGKTMPKELEVRTKVDIESPIADSIEKLRGKNPKKE
jgi:hypothetical protein